MADHSLRVSVAGISLEHPVMSASGILGSTPEGILKLAGMGFSAVVTKTITPEPREGFKPPIIIQLPTGGLMNAVGLANPGVKAVSELVKAGLKTGKPLIVSVGGRSSEEFVRVAEAVIESGASGIELNLSCPHTKGYGAELGSDPSMVRRVVRDVSSISSIPVLAKLGLSDRIIQCAEAALDAGASGLVLINTVKALFIDVYSLRPFLSGVYGGLSGPPIHPIAVRVIYDVYREFKPEIIGVGGVYNWETAAELIAAGAKAIQIGTALLIAGDKADLIKRIVKGLREWVTYHGARSISDLVGVAVKD